MTQQNGDAKVVIADVERKLANQFTLVLGKASRDTATSALMELFEPHSLQIAQLRSELNSPRKWIGNSLRYRQGRSLRDR